MVAAADIFEPFNHGYHRDSRVRLIVDDGRHFLARSEETWDIVSINVSDPHLPGGSSLFHTEFYDIVKRHLADGGVVIQHAFGTDADIVLRTLLRSFPHVLLFRAYGNGFNAVASMVPLEPDPALVLTLTDESRVGRALAGIGLIPPMTPSRFIRYGITRSAVERSIGVEGPIATDDRPVLEFAWSTNRALLLFSNE